MLLEQGPTGNTRSNQNARGYRKEGSLSPALVRFTELRKIAVARTAGSQVVQIDFSLCERNPVKSNSPQDFRAGTSSALWIGKFTQ